MVADPQGDAPHAAVVIRVTRSGGVAGIPRSWSVRSSESDDWPLLVDACPWDDEPPTTGADRFVWRIEVRAPEPSREARVPDAAMRGPWRELVERVRAQGEPVRPPTPTRQESTDG